MNDNIILLAVAAFMVYYWSQGGGNGGSGNTYNGQHNILPNLDRGVKGTSGGRINGC